MPTEAMLGSQANSDAPPSKGGCLWWKLLTTKKKCIFVAIILILLIILALIIYIIARPRRKPEPIPDQCVTRDCIESAGLISSYMDPEVDPCQDFYRFSCGSFVKKKKAPDPDAAVWGTFASLGYEAYIAAKNTLEEPGTRIKSEATKKMKSNYRACLKAMRSDSNFTLSDIMKELELSEDMDLEDMAATLYSMNVHALFETEIKPNSALEYFLLVIKDPSSQSIYGEQNEEAQIYKNMIKTVLMMLNVYDYNLWAEDILAFETRLNELKKEDSPEGTIERTPEKLNELTPEFDWIKFFQKLHELTGNEDVNVEEDVIVISHANNYLKRLFPFLKSTSKRTLYRFFLWRFIYQNAVYLGPKIGKWKDQIEYITYPRYHSRNGFFQKEPWRRCVQESFDLFPEALTAEYAKRMFDESQFGELKSYLDRIKENFKANVPKYTWLDEETRNLMIQKVNNMSLVIAYPPEILNPALLDEMYEEIDIDENNYFHNVLYISKIKAKDDISRIKTANQAKGWDYNPTDINAFNYQYKNTIVLPISILYPPVFQKDRPKYLNFGALGFVLAHELGHSFDTSGVNVDFRDPEGGTFFSPEMLEKYMKKVQCFIDQYGDFIFHYEAKPTNLNGTFALNDNLADQVGVHHAWQAYLKWEQEHGEEPPLPGLNYTAHQLFFVQSVQVFCEMYTSFAIATKVRKSDHSPGEYRAVGALVNLPDFAKEFNCPKGSFMNPTRRCELWI